MAGDELKIQNWQGTKRALQALMHPLALSQEERRQMIADAAYYRAERRGFAPGGEVDDWLAAEKEVAERLNAMAECAPQSEPPTDVRRATPKSASPAATSTVVTKGSAPAAESRPVTSKTTRKKTARRRKE